MKLSDAKLCLNYIEGMGFCDEIFINPILSGIGCISNRCPSCGSTHLWSLSGWLSSAHRSEEQSSKRKVNDHLGASYERRITSDSGEMISREAIFNSEGEWNE